MDEERINEAAEEASMEFWSAVADAFPEVTTGDLPPDAADDFRRAAKGVIERWLEVNAPDEGEAESAGWVYFSKKFLSASASAPA
jgi:hypothetical protein